MAAYTASQVTISNGSKAVVIHSNENPESVAKGDFLFLSGSDPKEINRTYINDQQKHVIELIENWDSGNKTNQPAIVLPTTVEFRDTIAAIKNANLLINDNMQAMNDWQTQEGEIVFTGLDGNSYTFPSLKGLQQQVDAVVAEANQATDRAIAAAADLQREEIPLVSAPFNDSAKLDYGYGKEYIAGLPVYGVDFTRSSECTFINKSGQLDSVGIDEPAIAEGGAWLHQAFTVAGIDSEDREHWSDYSGKNTIVSFHVEDGLQVTSVEYYAEDSASFSYTLGQTYSYDALGVAVGDVITVQYQVRSDTPAQFRATVYSYGSQGSVPDGDTFFTRKEWGTITFQHTRIEGQGTFNFQFFRLYTGTGTEGVVYQLRAPMVTIGANTELPYQVSGSESLTAIPATMATIPTSRNLPPPGKSFTVVVDALLDFGNNQANHLYMLSPQATEANYLGIKKTESNALELQINLGSWARFSIDLIEKSRFTVVVDVLDGDTTIHVYQNGVFKNETKRPGRIFDFGTDGHVVLGLDRAFRYGLNSQLKNFKILNYAASADEVQSWGSPK